MTLAVLVTILPIHRIVGGSSTPDHTSTTVCQKLLICFARSSNINTHTLTDETAKLPLSRRALAVLHLFVLCERTGDKWPADAVDTSPAAVVAFLSNIFHRKCDGVLKNAQFGVTLLLINVA